MSLCSFGEGMVWVIVGRVDVVEWFDEVLSAASKFRKATRELRVKLASLNFPL
jgi:hypothetical protein